MISVTTINDVTWAQSRKLPKAGFPVLAVPNSAMNSGTANSAGMNMTAPSSSLSTSYGLHLTPGLDRKPGMAPTPYNPGEPDKNMELVRWERKKMPLLIWISPGLQLPEATLDEIKATRVDFVTRLLQSPNPFLGMTQASGWTPDTNDQVAAGIEEWRQFENEGLISFAFTDNPRNANICIFFTDIFKGGNGPGGIAIGGNTAAQMYPLSLAQKINIKQKPVIIELSTLVNNTPQKMMGASAHEFGHALGIKAHSPFREDLMYGDRVVNSLSEADKATIRWLYKQQPQWVL